MKAYKFKLKINQAFVSKCEQTLSVCRELYNAGLQERRDAYAIARKRINFHKQAIQLPEIKLIREDFDGVHSQVLQDILRRLSKAFDAFFRRVKSSAEPGYPRFKGKHRFNSFTYPQSGFRLAGDKLTLSKIGSCRLRLSREIDGKIKTCTIKRQVDGWFVIFTAETPTKPLPKTGDATGIDVGIENFATLADGQIIENPHYLQSAQREIAIAQRQVSKKKLRGSNRGKAARLLARKHLKVTNQRRDFLHKLSNRLVAEYDTIAVEDLKIKGLVKNHHLARAISDAAWGTFVQILSCKAEGAGKRVVTVPAAFTSQDCSQCGARVKKALAVREHRCIGCGFVAHRDHNAAINILARTGPFVRANGVAR